MKLAEARWKRRIWKATQRSLCVIIKESRELTGVFLSRGEMRSGMDFRRNLRNAVVGGRCVPEKEKWEAEKQLRREKAGRRRWW